MSKYTTTIKNLKDNKFDFGLNDYPIFDEEYRSILNNLILNHYYMDEIGFETAELFKFYLNQKMNEIMPYYNSLYQVQKEMLNDSFDTIQYEEIFTSNSNNTGSSNSNSSSDTTNSSVAENNGENLFHNTSQGKTNLDEIRDGKYLTEYNQQKNKNNTTSDTFVEITDNTKNENNATQNSKRTIKGSNGVAKANIFETIKRNLININNQIIDDLEELFMGVL